MKAILLTINWVLSLCALSINTDTAPLTVVLGVVAWFCISSALLIRADRKGAFNKVYKGSRNGFGSVADSYKQ